MKITTAILLAIISLSVGCKEREVEEPIKLPPLEETFAPSNPPVFPVPGDEPPVAFNPKASWQVVYNGKYTNYGQENVITDGFGFSPKGKFPIAYLSAHYEDWRPDAKSFDLKGSRKLGKWKGEKYIDWDRPKNMEVMKQRILYVKRKGYKAIDWDNVDGPDGLAYFKWLARETKAEGLLVGLKNAVEFLPHVHEQVDFVVSEAYNKSEQTVYAKYGLAGVHMGYGSKTYPPLYRVRSKSKGNKY